MHLQSHEGKKGTRSKTVSTSKVLSFQNQQEPKKQPTGKGNNTFCHLSATGTLQVLRNSGSLGSGGMKEEQKHFPQVKGSGNPRCDCRNQNASLWEVHLRGSALSRTSWSSPEACAPPPPQGRTRAENSSHPR